MKKFNKLYNDIINEYYEDDKIIKQLQEMAFCPYNIFITQTIKNKFKRTVMPTKYNFLVDINRNTEAIYGEYHFYYRILNRCPHYAVNQIKLFIEYGLNKFLNDNYYSRYWNLTESDDIAFTIFSKTYNDIKIKINIFKTNNLKNLIINSNSSDYTCILNTILLTDMINFNTDNFEHTLTIDENSTAFNFNNIKENFSFSLYELLNNNNIFKDTIPIEIE